MTELVGQRIIGIVAQQPFESPGQYGMVHTFANLRPILLQDGSTVGEEEFPNNGLLFWMLRPGAAAFAEPGQLLRGTVQPATQPAGSDPAKSCYQVQKDSVEPVGDDDLAEIIEAPRATSGPLDLLKPRAIKRDRPTAQMVFVLWRGKLLGPFRAKSRAERETYFISLSKTGQVREIPEAALQSVKEFRRTVKATVSLIDRSPIDSHTVATFEYDLLLAEGLPKLLGLGAALELESQVERIRRLGKRFLSRSKRQNLSELLEELKTEAESVAEDVAEADLQALKDAVNQLEVEGKVVEELSKALIDSGRLKESIEKEIKERASLYIDKNVTRLQAETMSRVEDLEERRKSLTREVEELHARLETETRRRLAETEEVEEAIRKEKEAEIIVQRERLEKERDAIRNILETLANRFADAKEDVLVQFTQILPLLQRVGIVGGTPSGPAAASTQEVAARVTARPFNVPSWITEEEAGCGEEVSELDFFERFRNHVKESGFRYRKLDLVTFHLSVKSNDLTILGGVSGTGKSTLPRLYQEALEARATGTTRRYHQVGVSPSWLEPRDLLGHVNSLEGRYEPSESGLYQHLICAQEEHQRRDSASGVYIVNLDEMNLAYVEHYFSAFLQCLEHGANRVVRCFTQENVEPTSSFARWPEIMVPRSVRFVGTVNLDETTKPLSLRLLDRTNFIRLRPEHALYELPLEVGNSSVQPQGPPIAYSVFHGWRGAPGLPAPFARVLDDLRPHLATLGCPLNPRRSNAIRQFIGGAPAELCSPEIAFDLQLAQRLFPQIRGVFRREAREALDGVARVLDDHELPFEESLRVLEEVRGVEYDLDLDRPD